MADTGIFATTEEVQRKAGANASTVSNTEAYINDFISQAESLINVITEINWSDSYAAQNADVKGMLKMAASAKAAMMVIDYDINSFPSAREAETMLDILNNEFDIAIKYLRDQGKKAFIQNA